MNSNISEKTIYHWEKNQRSLQQKGTSKYNSLEELYVLYEESFLKAEIQLTSSTAANGKSKHA